MAVSVHNDYSSPTSAPLEQVVSVSIVCKALYVIAEKTN